MSSPVNGRNRQRRRQRARSVKNNLLKLFPRNHTILPPLSLSLSSGASFPPTGAVFSLPMPSRVVASVVDGGASVWGTAAETVVLVWFLDLEWCSSHPDAHGGLVLLSRIDVRWRCKSLRMWRSLSKNTCCCYVSRCYGFARHLRT